MRKIKPVVEGILLIVFELYCLSASGMACYYWWKDVKIHDSFVRAALLSPIIGTFKATHWPYYEFCQRRGGHGHAPPSIDHLRRSIELYQSAQPLIKGLPSSEDLNEDSQAIITLLRCAEAEVQKADRTELNSITPGLGDAVMDKYLRALEYYNSALAPNGDRNDAFRGDAAMIEFTTWMQKNSELPQ
jgi:hypothetical protein